MKRASGVLMHITSLPGQYGIGTLGKEARNFVGWLVDAGQTYWQILPVGPTGFGASPYSSCSAFAGNPNLIDFDQVIEDGYLEEADVEDIFWGDDPTKVDYEAVEKGRNIVFDRMAERFSQNIPEDFEVFCQENEHWLEDYALYMAIWAANEFLPLYRWPKDILHRRPKAMEKWRGECADEILKIKMEQYFFFRQWTALKKYANERGIKILGDIPIYVPVDSADVWGSPKNFALDENYVPIEVAGCPPDAFSADGQLWGNPVYDFKYMKRRGYAWWVARFAQLFKLCDIVRVDHFRAFDAYYCIPFGSENARTGVWREGPGLDFFRTVEKKLGLAQLPLVAEDLGFLTESVYKLVKDTGYPGMKILQFAFNPWDKSTYLPHNYDRNCIVYAGTHDNNTSIGWYQQDADPGTREFFQFYTGMPEGGNPAEAMMRTAMTSVADTAIVTMQDVIGLGAEARMNVPSTVGGNWSWRAMAGQITWDKSSALRRLTDAACRLNGSR